MVNVEVTGAIQQKRWVISGENVVDFNLSSPMVTFSLIGDFLPISLFRSQHRVAAVNLIYLVQMRDLTDWNSNETS